jgi:hypothetical protein
MMVNSICFYINEAMLSAFVLFLILSGFLATIYVGAIKPSFPWIKHFLLKLELTADVNIYQKIKKTRITMLNIRNAFLLVKTYTSGFAL